MYHFCTCIYLTLGVYFIFFGPKKIKEIKFKKWVAVSNCSEHWPILQKVSIPTKYELNRTKRVQTLKDFSNPLKRVQGLHSELLWWFHSAACHASSTIVHGKF